MKAQDKPRLVAMMLKLQSVFPKDLNEHTYDAYFMALENWKIDAIEKVALYLVRTETFFPLPAVFINRLDWIESIIRPKEIQGADGKVKYIMDKTFFEPKLELPTPTVKELLKQAENELDKDKIQE